MAINVFGYQIINGKSYDAVETIDKEQLKELIKEYRNKVGAVKTEVDGKFYHNPDVVLYYKDPRSSIELNNLDDEDIPEQKKVQQKPKESVLVQSKQFKQTTKTVKELIRFPSRE